MNISPLNMRITQKSIGSNRLILEGATLSHRTQYPQHPPPFSPTIYRSIPPTISAFVSQAYREVLGARYNSALTFNYFLYRRLTTNPGHLQVEASHIFITMLVITQKKSGRSNLCLVFHSLADFLHF